MKTSHNKIVLFIATICLFILMLYLPIIVKVVPMKISYINRAPGYKEDYELDSLVNIMDNIDCVLYCFPNNEQTRTFNLRSIIISLVVFLIICTYIYIKLIKKINK